jgi:DNA mismatch endonuclease (patch repair protein)
MEALRVLISKSMERALKEKLSRGKFSDVDPRTSRLMRNVRGRGNRTTEARFRGALISAGIRGWKLNVKTVTGSPDFFFPEERAVIFVDGCFWHGCEKCGHIPKKNRAFWSAKINRNRERDASTTAWLRRNGFAVIRFWEHQVANSLADCIGEVDKKMRERRKSFSRRKRTIDESP